VPRSVKVQSDLNCSVSYQNIDYPMSTCYFNSTTGIIVIADGL
jgi:hypothetical protein